MAYSAYLQQIIREYNVDVMDAVVNPGEAPWEYVSGYVIVGTDGKVEGFQTDGGWYATVNDMHPLLVVLAQMEADDMVDPHSEDGIYFDEALLAARYN